MEEIDRPDKRDQHFTQKWCAVEQGAKLDALKTYLLMSDEELQGLMAAYNQFGRDGREELSEYAGRMLISSQ